MFATSDKVHARNYFLCSYCYAVYEILSNNEGLSERDREAYKRHLIDFHGLKEYCIQR